MSVDFDWVIAGAGCAGTSLAVHLLDAGVTDRRILVVEPRSELPRDRTWCFFDVERHPFERAITHRWHAWSVAGSAGSVTRRADGIAYAHVPSDAFHAEGMRRLREAPSVTLALGTRVDRIEDRGDRVVVHTSAGERSAHAAFDSRPARPTASRRGPFPDVRMVQHFLGWHVRTARPVFEPSTAMLMDFRVEQPGEIHFVYVLPFSDREALVEDTFFGAAPKTAAVYERTLESYLARLGGGEHEILGRERGAIPMTTETFDPSPSARVRRIGVAAGLARPSTGYAFLAIQRASRALARALAAWRSTDDVPFVPARPLRTRFLDHVFLRHLADDPAGAPDLFARLFESAPPAALARFLSESGSPLDDLAVIRAMPSVPLMRSMLALGRGSRPVHPFANEEGS